jgi:ankyrin repeat protein
VEVGTEGTVSVEGTMDDRGCKFLLQNSSGVLTCCFSMASRGDQLCDPGIQGASCRERGSYTVEEEPARCVLRLPDFQLSDTGIYRAIFPACQGCSRNQELVAFTPWEGWKTALLVLFCLVILVICLLVYLFVWRPHQLKKKKKRDEKIIRALMNENQGEYANLLNNRSIYHVLDNGDNNIFHLAARPAWNNTKTNMVHARRGNQAGQALGDIYKVNLSSVHWTDRFPQKVLKHLRLETLKPKTINLNSKNRKRETPLIIACAESTSPVVEILMELQVDQEVVDIHDNNALYYAVRNGSFEIVEMLLKNNARLDGNFLTYLAVSGGSSTKTTDDDYHNRLRTLDQLLQHGANSNGQWRLEGGMPCIKKAVEEVNPMAVKLLRKRMNKDENKEVLNDALALAVDMKKGLSKDNASHIKREQLKEIIDNWPIVDKMMSSLPTTSTMTPASSMTSVSLGQDDGVSIEQEKSLRTRVSNLFKKSNSDVSLHKTIEMHENPGYEQD